MQRKLLKYFVAYFTTKIMKYKKIYKEKNQTKQLHLPHTHNPRINNAAIKCEKRLQINEACLPSWAQIKPEYTLQICFS